MIYRALKYPIHVALQRLNDWRTYQFVSRRFTHSHIEPLAFDFPKFKKDVLRFIESLQTDESKVRYRYSATCSKPTLYSSAYACVTYSLLNELNSFDEKIRSAWVDYFNSFQSEKDGLFYDPVIQNEHYNDSDWWGARHLALHMINAYTDLQAKPRYPFYFLERYYNLRSLEDWLLVHEKMFTGSMSNDFDNKLMNISCLLQYQRDFWNDEKAGKAVTFIQQFLLKRLNSNTGIWGDHNVEDDVQRSRKVQFAYHLFPPFFYDKKTDFDFGKVIKITLDTQNKFGGFGVAFNSSACDDIDSVDILIRASEYEKRYEVEINESLRRGIHWILLNQMSDGGFVFRLNESFTYGSDEMSSIKNQGAIFPTWFRTLSLAYLCRFLNIEANFKITRCPGYEF
jgi:hypothetical protein